MKKRIVSALSAVLVEILFLSSCDLNTEPSSEDAVDYFESENNVATSIANNYTKKPVEPTETPSIEPTQEPETEITSTTLPATTTTITTIAVEPPAEYQELVVHFIDVGQGDSTFIELPTGETMLIDAGESEYGDKVVDYIYSQGYDTLDYSNCPSVDQMKDKKKAYTDDYAGAIAQGYVPCKNCNPTG